MEVKFTGDTRQDKTTKGDDVSLENGKIYKCMEKEYHSALFVRIRTDSGEHIKVKRGEIQKV